MGQSLPNTQSILGRNTCGEAASKMNINEILKEKGMTKYRLAVLSGVPHATLNNICSGQAKIEKCSAETLYKLAQVLDVTIEDLIVDAMKGVDTVPKTIPFELFKSNVCHRVKDCGDIPFIVETLKSDEIRSYYNQKQYPQAFYLLAMVDYLSRENDLPLCSAYSDMRKQKLVKPIYPQSVIAMAKVMDDDTVITESLDNAIPEFRRFNIAENEVRYVI